MTSYTIQSGDYAPFHHGYVELMRHQPDILQALRQQRNIFLELISSVPEARGNDTYAAGKWTFKQVFQHVIDTERVFTFRLLAMSRAEKQAIPGFEQDEYMAALDLSGRTVAAQRKEFETVRDAALTLVESVSAEEASRHGTVSGYPLAAGAVPYIMAGHAEHHIRILRERYGL